MNEENTKKLFDDFPVLLREGLAYGFECKDGWYELLRQLFTKLETLWKAYPNGQPADAPVILQVKEKFGLLRVYLSWQTAAMSSAIKDAEAKSARTCEICGQPGTMHQRGNWLRTTCESCWKP